MAANLNELIFIKRVKKHPHEQAHGGAWKIAYADFVTAMMAFFLLLWLLNSTSKEQRNAISNYFAPQSASKTTSGAGGVLGGRVLDTEGALTASRATPRIILGVPQMEPGTMVEVENPREGQEDNSGPLPKNDLKDATGEAMGTVPAHDLKSRNEAALGTVPANDAKNAHDVALARAKETSGTEPLEGTGGSYGPYPRDNQGLMPDGGAQGLTGPAAEAAAKAAAAAKAEDARLDELARQLNERIANDKVLRDYKSNISVERTAEGLRIQILDDDKREMFPLGSSELLEHTSKLFKTVADLVKNQPNRIAISGHTDATPYRGTGGYSNWELSSDRANASRRALMAAGVPEGRIARVVGKADTEPMDAAHPEAAINRRVSIVLLRDSGGGTPAGVRQAAVAPTPVPAKPSGEASTTPAASPPALTPMPRPVLEPVPEPSPTPTTVTAPRPVTPEPAMVPVLEIAPPTVEAPKAIAPPPETAKSAPAETPAEPDEPAEGKAAEPDGDVGMQDNWLRLR